MPFRLRPIRPSRRFSGDARAAVARATRELDLWAWDTLARMQRYPPQITGLRHHFKGPRERAGFFYKLRRGLIQVPYRRTLTLGRSWSRRLLNLAARVVAQVGSNDAMAPYGHFVEGYSARVGRARDRQTREMGQQRHWPAIDVAAKFAWAKRLPRIRAALGFRK